MKFFKSKAEINQSLNIVVPNKDIEEQVSTKLKAAQKDSKLKGFRKGKAPMDVVSSMFGPEIRQEVIWDLASKTFSKLAQEKDLKIVSRPNLIPESLDEGKDAKFKATFEVYPEVSLAKISKISFTNFLCDITDEDLDKTINNLQKRMSQWEPVDEVSKDGDQIKINFVGRIEGEEFEGGTAEDFSVEIGSKSMIKGFEEGLIGLKKGDKKILELNFPEDYGKKELASKPVSFDTEVNEVLSPKLPELNEEFFKSTGIEAADVDSYKKEVRTKLEEDLENILKGKVKQSLFDALIEVNEFEVPSAMIDSEISNMKQDTARRMGMDPKEIKEDLFPNETFSDEATKRVKVGILLNKIIEDKELKPDADKVKEIIEERAKNYKDPQQVINYFYSDEEQLRNIESISLEEQVVDALLTEAKSSEENISYEDCVSGTYG
ncbi:trigger factor [Gammaproteobacteria bacterium]|jgi:trigger factor|nr:trigger factor [SAR86 cluster bacterium]MDB4815831.1 trigger factor [Gammaproteobacteria bacterium]MDC0545642.1 trigger factor [Gammaproteobacteria bacterium]|tara:strand:+ start:409 stop:1713 length:1305 start_codon:yes stop_codon:yes gene_type:complete